MSKVRTPRGLSGILLVVVASILWTTVGGPFYPAQAGPLAQVPFPTPVACTPTSTRFVGTMTGAQEVPPTTSAATGNFDMQLAPDGQTLFVYILTQNLNLATVTASHIHGSTANPGPPGVNAPVTVDFFLGPTGTFTNPFTPARPAPVPAGAVIVPPAVLEAMRTGIAYVNIHTTTFPGGEIRGQIQCAPPPAVACTGASTSFRATLTPAQEVPPTRSTNSGTATMQLAPDGRTMTVTISTTIPVDQVTRAHIHGSITDPGLPGRNAGITVTFFERDANPPINAPWREPFTVTVTDVPITTLQAMRTGQAYVNVHTVTFPGGEIRGQVECAAAPATVSTTTNVPPTSGQAGTPCTGLAGQTCGVSGGANGVWTKAGPGTTTGGGTFAITAQGPANTLPGGTPAIFLPTTVGVEGFLCNPVGVAAPFGAACTGTTRGDLQQGAIVTVRFPLVGGGTADVSGTVAGSGTGPVLTVQQVISQITATGQPNQPCATGAGQICRVAGGVTGTGNVTGNLTSGMRWNLTATVPAGVVAGTIPIAVFSTTQGLQGFPCGAVAAGGAGTLTCTGTTAGIALQGSLVTVFFGTGLVTTGTVTGPGQVGQGAGAALPLLPPAPFAPAPLPPLNLIPPPPPPLPPPGSMSQAAGNGTGATDSGQMPQTTTQRNGNGMPDVPRATPTPTPAPMSSGATTPPMRPAAPESMPVTPLVPDPMPAMPAPLPAVEPIPVPAVPEPLPAIEPGSATPDSETESPSSVAPSDPGEVTLPAIAEQP